MKADELTGILKDKALESGILKVGVASKANMEGPPEAVMDDILPGAKTAISLLVIENEDQVLDFLGKKDVIPYRDHFYDNNQLLGRVALELANDLKANGYQAQALSPNAVYKKGSNPTTGLIPEFSHRYAALAAGIGALGYSGNVMTPEYGSRTLLSTVLTDAPLAADQPMDEKDNPCDQCKMCTTVCAPQFMNRDETVTFTMGGREFTHNKKKGHGRCAVTCGGLTGLSPDGKWSTVATSIMEIPDDDKECGNMFYRLIGAKLQYIMKNPDAPNFADISQPMEGYDPKKQGILARTKKGTHVTCGHCAIVCMETKEKRAKAVKTLFNSGVTIAENKDGTPVVVNADEARKYRESLTDEQKFELTTQPGRPVATTA